MGALRQLLAFVYWLAEISIHAGKLEAIKMTEEAKNKVSHEFGWLVVNRKGDVCAERRTLADASATRNRMQILDMGDAPFRVVERAKLEESLSG